MAEEQDPGTAYCDPLDRYLPLDHPYFSYISHIRLAQASLGIAASDSKKLEVTKSFIEILDTLSENLFDPDTVLQDSVRKPMNHVEDVWLDMKEKMMQGDVRGASLLSAHSHLKIALGYLVILRKDDTFREYVTDYLLKYMGKLSIMIYREAMGHVLL